MAISERALKTLTEMQQNEVDEHEIYKNIAAFVKDDNDRETLLRIAEDEAAHAKVWEGYTGKKCTPRKMRVRFYTFIARLLGYTFALKKMEGGEDTASETYRQLIDEIPEADRIVKDEEEHEAKLLDMLDEERLQYVGAMVLGLNDALVELTGTLAGMAFALQNNRLVALSGLITGVSATFSMTASSYLSAKSEQDPNAIKSCAYTGIMYLITVVLLVAPYLLMPVNSFVAALVVMMITVALIILAFNYYISVAKSLNFKERFLEMLVISGSVAVLSFVVGLVVKAWLGIDI
ncbi:MAG: VIT1/CCC1 transporter family protein [Oscillospiraceae bacterium]|nr:VIT1/CCC1 transporter family protein [Oscillospiraceae bacterium]